MRTVMTLGLATALAACSTMTMRISRGELQADLDRRFPVEIDKALARISVTDPVLEFPGDPGRLALRFRVAAAAGTVTRTGRVRVEGRIEYQAAEHAFYLRDPQVSDLRLDPAPVTPPAPVEDPALGATVAGGPPPPDDSRLGRLLGKAETVLGPHLVERAIAEGVEEVLARHPVYRLDAARNEREAKAIRHLRSVTVDGQALVLEVGL